MIEEKKNSVLTESQRCDAFFPITLKLGRPLNVSLIQHQLLYKFAYQYKFNVLLISIYNTTEKNYAKMGIKIYK